MKLTDEEIQQLLEKGLSPSNTAGASENDLATYQLLFDALKKEPPGGLPYNFTAKLTHQLQVRKNRAADIKFYLLAITIPVVLLGGACALFILLGNKAAVQMANDLLRYKWPFIFVLSAFLVVQYLDQKLVKEYPGA